MTGPDEATLAFAWLFGCPPDDPAAPADPPTARPLVTVRCGGQPGGRCTLGRVYETPAGLLFTGLQSSMFAATAVGHPEKAKIRRAVLLTDPGGRPRPVEFLPLSCRHGQAGGFESLQHVDAVRERAKARADRPGTRPADYIVEG